MFVAMGNQGIILTSTDGLGTKENQALKITLEV